MYIVYVYAAIFLSRLSTSRPRESNNYNFKIDAFGVAVALVNRPRTITLHTNGAAEVHILLL